ncbi:hypothetical protein CSUI_006597 [Cystoisospora suis]|uniref:Uncharacterized protein n=1 Tax=Cystoisospora suis TaxID=483139 RepID=A0A2C6KTE2_9APIC|nr:hypothetical protein CSUI_006597 [Cystoisospora suis]
MAASSMELSLPLSRSKMKKKGEKKRKGWRSKVRRRRRRKERKKMIRLVKRDWMEVVAAVLILGRLKRTCAKEDGRGVHTPH